MSVCTNITPQKTNIPSGWKWVRLGDICSTTSGGTPSRVVPDYYGGDIPWVKSGELEDTIIFKTEEHITRFGLDNSNAKIMPVGTLMIALYGATVGKLGILGCEAATNQAICAITPSKSADVHYLFHYLFCTRRQLVETSYGGAQPNISQEIIRNLLVPLPPLPEQKRIAAILNEQMAAVEKARAACEAQLEAAKILPAAYLRSVFESEEAKKWERIPLGNLCSIEAQLVDPKIQQYCDMPHISSENIVGGECRLQNIRTALEDGMTSGKFLFRCGDVLYSKIRPYLRKAAKVDFTGLCSADIYPLHVNTSKLDSEFLLWLLVSDGFTSYADEESRRARMPKLNKEQLFAYKAPLPNIHQQQQIAQDINKQVGACYNLKVKLEAQLVEISRLPSAILRKAFRGEL